MKVTIKGQVTIPKEVRDEMGIRPSETEVAFVREKSGKWFLNKTTSADAPVSRFRSVHKTGKIKMSTDEILALTRG